MPPPRENAGRFITFSRLERGEINGGTPSDLVGVARVTKLNDSNNIFNEEDFDIYLFIKIIL